MLHFKPKYDFENGISEFTSWVDCQEIMINNYDQSIEELRIKGLFK
jgi:dTDP-L-rhamnose 4-epimerase